MGMEGDFLQLLKERGYQFSAPASGLEAQPAEAAEITKGTTILATTQRCLPMRRLRRKPCCSNIASVPLCRNDDEAERPSTSSG